MNQRPLAHHSQGELRRAEAATWGPKPQSASPTATIRRWQPYRNPSGTMLGYLSVELPSGLVINDAKLMMGPQGALWIAMPSQKRVDRDGNPAVGQDGKQSYSQFVEFANRAAADKFRDLVLDALRRDHPDALEGFDP